jgi:hypothetical protein
MARDRDLQRRVGTRRRVMERLRDAVVLSEARVNAHPQIVRQIRRAVNEIMERHDRTRSAAPTAPQSASAGTSQIK